MRICSAALDLFQADGRTHMTKLIGTVLQLSLRTCQSAMRYTEARRIHSSFLNDTISAFQRKVYHMLTKTKDLSSPFAKLSIIWKHKGRVRGGYTSTYYQPRRWMEVSSQLYTHAAPSTPFIAKSHPIAASALWPVWTLPLPGIEPGFLSFPA
jgi:hypothetical protein